MQVSIPLPVLRFLHRYHLTIFVVLVLGGLALVILSVDQTVTSASTIPTSSTTSSTDIPAFDKATMQKIDALQPSGTPTPLNLSGRYNPFSE